MASVRLYTGSIIRYEKNMKKGDKIKSLANAMTTSVRGMTKEGQLDPDGEKFYHFSGSAPEELENLYLEHYEVRDIDYETFSRACDIVSEIYEETPEADNEKIEEGIYERASDSASVYTSTRLEYLNIWNQDEISDIMREYGTEDIATACAIWYDRQVEQATIIIKDWIEAGEGNTPESISDDGSIAV